MRARTSDRRLLFRFGVGAIGLGFDRLLGRLRSPNEKPRGAPPAGRHYRLVGALVSAPALVDSAARAGQAFYDHVARLVSLPLRVARTTVVGARIERGLHRVRVDVNHTLASWDELGRAEIAAGRALAAAALGGLRADVFARLAGPELAELVQQQSAGLTRSVVDELRERSARADTRAEELVRRLRRKR